MYLQQVCDFFFWNHIPCNKLIDNARGTHPRDSLWEKHRKFSSPSSSKIIINFAISKLEYNFEIIKNLKKYVRRLLNMYSSVRYHTELKNIAS